MIEKKWEQVLAEYINTFINAKNELDYEIVALKLIGEIQDIHANYRVVPIKFKRIKARIIRQFNHEI